MSYNTIPILLKGKKQELEFESYNYCNAMKLKEISTQDEMTSKKQQQTKTNTKDKLTFNIVPKKFLNLTSGAKPSI